MKNYIRVSNFERRKRKTGNTFNSIPRLKYLLNWDSIYIYWGSIMKIKFSLMNFVSIEILPPRNEIPNIFINLIFQWYEKSCFYWAKNTSFYVPQQLNNLWQWTLLTHSILYSVIWFVTSDRKTFFDGKHITDARSTTSKVFFDNLIVYHKCM